MEFERSYGWTPSPPDIRDYKYVPEYPLLALPTVVNLDIPSPGSPFDPGVSQGRLGCCGPTTAANDIVFRSLLGGFPINTPSRLFVYYCTRELMGTTGSDSGVNNRTMLKAIRQYGYCDETLWPYDISKFTVKPNTAAYSAAIAQAQIFTYLSVQQDLNIMKSCIAAGQPIIFGFTVYESMETPTVDASGDIPMPKMNERVLGGHDVLLTGYDDATRKFRLKNPWGPGWGLGGYGFINYDYVNPSLSNDYWTVTTKYAPQPPTPPDPTPTPPAGQFSLSITGRGAIDTIVCPGFTITKA